MSKTTKTKFDDDLRPEYDVDYSKARPNRFASLGYNGFMATITLEEIQRDPKGLLERLQAGETVLLTDHDKALAEIKPIRKQRPIGLAKGQFVVPDDFDDPLPEEMLKLFEGKE